MTMMTRKCLKRCNKNCTGKKPIHFQPGVLCFLIFVFLLVFVSVNVETTHAQTTPPSLIMPAQIPASPGETVTVPVNFEPSGNSVCAIAFSIDYDQNLLALNPADNDHNGIPDAVKSYVPSGFVVSVGFNPSDTDSELDISIFDMSLPFNEITAGTLFTIDFTTGFPSQSTEAAVNFSEQPSVSFGSTGGQSIPGGGSDGSVYIEVSELTWLGDVNSDDSIDISDVILVLRIALGLDLPKLCSDINNDGKVDISDVILTLRLALKLDSPQPCTGQ